MASIIPEIPHDKLYHIFVCYEKNSLDVVVTIVGNLEKEGIKCCYYERDFTPGRSVITNMYESITNSLLMLIVLSKDFENSPFCKDELDRALHLRAAGKYNLIPIRIESCSVPESLRHIVYIDVEDCIDGAHEQIIEAMSTKEFRIELIEDRNGECLQYEMQNDDQRLKFSETDRSEIRSNGYKVSAEILQEIEDTVNGSSFVKYKHIIEHPYRNIFYVFLYVLILLITIFVVLLLNTGVEKTDKFQPVAYYWDVGTAWLWLLGMSIFLYFLRDECSDNVFSKTYSVLKTKLWYISQQNIAETGVIFFIELYRSNPSQDYCIRFYIMRYNFEPCKAYFAKQLDKMAYLKKFRRENETNEECTSWLFGEFLRNNSSQLADTSTANRHKKKNNPNCVCHLVEDWLKLIK